MINIEPSSLTDVTLGVVSDNEYAVRSFILAPCKPLKGEG
jgi:hypothetical protein